MKYFFFIPLFPFLYLEMITPFIRKCLLCDKIRGIVKSLSGLLQKMQMLPTFDNKHIEPNSIIQLPCEPPLSSNANITTVCDPNCNIQMILPGYMEHDPKQNPL